MEPHPTILVFQYLSLWELHVSYTHNVIFSIPILLPFFQVQILFLPLRSQTLQFVFVLLEYLTDWNKCEYNVQIFFARNLKWRNCSCDVWAYVTEEFFCLKCKVFCFIVLCILLVCKMPLLIVVYVCIKHIVLSCKLRAVYMCWHI